jgi:hypothetical protein
VVGNDFYCYFGWFSVMYFDEWMSQIRDISMQIYNRGVIFLKWFAPHWGGRVSLRLGNRSSLRTLFLGVSTD